MWRSGAQLVLVLAWGRGHGGGQAGLEVGSERQHRLLLLLLVGEGG